MKSNRNLILAALVAGSCPAAASVVPADNIDNEVTVSTASLMPTSAR